RTRLPEDRPMRRYFAALVSCGLAMSLALHAAPALAQFDDDDVPQAKPKTKASSKATTKSSKSNARTKTGKLSKKNVDKELAPGVRNYASDNFLVHTDLPDDEAQDLMERLETMLRLISTYWAKPNARTIEMYVVKNINVWPQGLIPQEGLDHITA